MEQLESYVLAADLSLPTDVLDRIDDLVAPGVSLTIWRWGVPPRTPGYRDGHGPVVGVTEQSLAAAERSTSLGVETGEVALTGSFRGPGAVDRVGEAA
jgi:hypothetical protein